jgi:hypothetical protein
MGKQALILHVGMPKTGSSALQSVLYSNRDFLTQQGFEYAEIDGNTAMPKHQYLVTELLQNRFVRTPDILGRASKHGLILSSEGLTNHLYDFPREALSEFRHLIRDFDSKIFVVLRSPQEWARSYYKQAVINPRIKLVGYYACALTFSEFVQLPRVRQLMAHQTLLNDLRCGFGVDNLITADFHADWLQVFSNLIGVPPENLKGFAQVNQSPPNWLIEILRQVNQFALPEPRRLAWKAVLQDFAKTNHVTMKKAHKHMANGDIALEGDVLAALIPATHDGFDLSPEMLAGFRVFVRNL